MSNLIRLQIEFNVACLEFPILHCCNPFYSLFSHFNCCSVWQFLLLIIFLRYLSKKKNISIAVKMALQLEVNRIGMMLVKTHDFAPYLCFLLKLGTSSKIER